MQIGRKIRSIRECQNLSQGDIEARTGLLRCYISRVENGYTVPAVETLEKIASAFQLPLYELFREEKDPPPRPIKRDPLNPSGEWGSYGSAAQQLRKLRTTLGKLTDKERGLLLYLAHGITRRPRSGNQTKRN